MARLVPALAGVQLQPAFELKLNGPIDRLGVDMNVRSSAGQVNGNIVADVKAPGSRRPATVSVRHLDLSPILNDAGQKSDITADVALDLHGEGVLGHRFVRRDRVGRRAAHRRRRFRGRSGEGEGAHRGPPGRARRPRGGVRGDV